MRDKREKWAILWILILDLAKKMDCRYTANSPTNSPVYLDKFLVFCVREILMIRRISILALVVLSMVAMATTAYAAYCTAPEWVIAQEDGHFVVAMTVYTGSAGAATVDAETLLGTANCSEDRRREQGCEVEIPMNDTYHFIYEGNIDDPTMDGMVELGIEFCGETENLLVSIDILKFGTVATDEGSFDSIKALYR